MLRNLSNSSATSAGRRENLLPSLSPLQSAGTSSKGLLASTSPYSKSAYGARSPAVKMGLLGSFAILFLLVASSFASEEQMYANDSTPLSNLRGADVGLSRLGGARMTKSAMLRQSAPEHQAFSRSVTEEGEASFGEMMGAEDNGMAKSDGPTLGSELVSKMEQTLQANKDGGAITTIQRMLVHSGHVSLQAPQGNATEIADQISNLISKDGYVEDRSESLSSTHWSGKRDRKTIRMQLRVPSPDFHQILDEIQGMVDEDHILSVSSQSRDVTDEYIDASARADTLSASRDALKTILARANSIKDVLAVKTELGSMTEQIESLRRRAVYLKKQAVSCGFIKIVCTLAFVQF